MLQNWSEVFRRELDQLQTWKDHSPHKIAHTSDTTTSSVSPPNQAQVQWFSRRTHRTHWKLLYSCLWLLQGKNQCQSDKKRAQRHRPGEAPGAEPTGMLFLWSHGHFPFPELIVPVRMGYCQPGQLPRASVFRVSIQAPLHRNGPLPIWPTSVSSPSRDWTVWSKPPSSHYWSFWSGQPPP